MRADAPSPALLVGAVAVGILAVSTGATLLRLSEAGPMAKAFHRLFFATLLVGAFALARRRAAFATLSRGDVAPLAAGGLLLGLHFATWIASLDYTTVAASLFLVTSHPILVALASHFRGERLRAVGWVGLGLAFLGAAAILALDGGPVGGGPPHPNFPLGNALALAGAVAIAGYFLVARRVRQRVDLVPYVTVTYAVASLALLAAMVVAGEPLVGYSTREYGIFLALALVPMVLGHTILNWAIRWVEAPVVATTVLGEPVAGSALAFLVLAEIPAVSTLVGGALVLSGIALVVRGQAR